MSDQLKLRTGARSKKRAAPLNSEKMKTVAKASEGFFNFKTNAVSYHFNQLQFPQKNLFPVFMQTVNFDKQKENTKTLHQTAELKQNLALAKTADLQKKSPTNQTTIINSLKGDTSPEPTAVTRFWNKVNEQGQKYLPSAAYHLLSVPTGAVETIGNSLIDLGKIVYNGIGAPLYAVDQINHLAGLDQYQPKAVQEFRKNNAAYLPDFGENLKIAAGLGSVVWNSLPGVSLMPFISEKVMGQEPPETFIPLPDIRNNLMIVSALWEENVTKQFGAGQGGRAIGNTIGAVADVLVGMKGAGKVTKAAKIAEASQEASRFARFGLRASEFYATTKASLGNKLHDFTAAVKSTLDHPKNWLATKIEETKIGAQILLNGRSPHAALASSNHVAAGESFLMQSSEITPKVQNWMTRQASELSSSGGSGGSNLFGKYGVDEVNSYLKQFGIHSTSSQSEIASAVTKLSPEKQNEVMKRIALGGHLRQMQQDVQLASQIKPGMIDDMVKTAAESGEGQKFLKTLEQAELGETTTMHPLQFLTPKSEYFSTALSRRLQRLHAIENELGTTTNSNVVSLLNVEKAKLEKQVTRIVTKFEDEPLFMTKRPSGLDEVKLKLPYTKQSISGWSSAQAQLKTSIFERLNQGFEKSVVKLASWMGIDFDRNVALTAKGAFASAQNKAQAAFQMHARALQKTAHGLETELGGQSAKFLAYELKEIRRRLLNTGLKLDEGMNLPGRGVDTLQDLSSRAYTSKPFASAEEFASELRALRNNPAYAPYRDKLEKLITQADMAGFHLVTGEARHNAQAIEDVVSVLYKNAKIEQPIIKANSVKSELAAFSHLYENFDKLAKLDLNALHFNGLQGSRLEEAQKLIACLEEYKRVRSAYGNEALSRIVIAESRSPLQMLQLKLLSKMKGLPIEGENAIKIIPLVESGYDKFFMRDFISRMRAMAAKKGSAADALKAFLNNPEIMQAASDTLRVEGHINGLRANFAYLHYLMREFLNPKLYVGIGTDPQRIGGILPAKLYDYLLPGMKRFRSTLQGSDVAKVYRTQDMAASNVENAFTRFIKNANEPVDAGYFKKADKPIRNWTVRARNAFNRMVFGKKGADITNDMMELFHPAKFVPSLNTGSRAGAGAFGIDYQALDKFSKTIYEKARAITLANSGKSSGLPHTTLGMGHALESSIKGNKILLNDLHEAYKTVPGFRLTVDTTARITAYGNTAIHTQGLAGLPRRFLNRFNYHHRDLQYLRKYLPQIIEGPQTTARFEDLSIVNEALGVPHWSQTSQAVIANSTRHLKAADQTLPMMGTQTETWFDVMRNAMGALARITGRFG